MNKRLAACGNYWRNRDDPRRDTVQHCLPLAAVHLKKKRQ